MKSKNYFHYLFYQIYSELLYYEINELHQFWFGNYIQKPLTFVSFSDVVLKTGLGLKTGFKTIFLRSWSWPKRSCPWP